MQRTATAPEIKAQSGVPRLGGLWFFAFLVVTVVVVVFWHWRHLLDLRSLSIASLHADMLPLMLAGFADLDQLRSPYRPHAVPWLLYNYYLPATFWPYYAGYKLHVDPRWVTVLCLDALNVVLAALVWRRPRVTALAVYAAVSTLVNLAIDVPLFVRVIHLGPFWLYTGLTFTLLALGRTLASTTAFALAVASREDALVYAIVPAVAALKHCGQQGRRLVSIAAAGVVLLLAPFVLADPKFYAGNIRQYESLTWVLEQTGGQGHVGFAGPLFRAGLLSYRWPLLFTLLGAVVALYWTRSRRFDAQEVTRYAAVAALLFALFALVPWPYVYVAPAVILGVAALGSRGWWLAFLVAGTAVVVFAATTTRAVPPTLPDPCQAPAFQHLVTEMARLDRNDAAFVERAEQVMRQAKQAYEQCSIRG